jgi:hypothetical protein
LVASFSCLLCSHGTETEQGLHGVRKRCPVSFARQRIHIGIVHAGRTLTVESADHTFRIYDGDQLLAETGRTTTKPIARFKVRKPEPPRQRHPAQGSAIWH